MQIETNHGVVTVMTTSEPFGETGVSRYYVTVTEPACLAQYFTHIDAFSQPPLEAFAPLLNKVFESINQPTVKE